MTMEDLLDKLKLLNYEKEIVAKMGMRPLNRFIKDQAVPAPPPRRHYFVLQTNPGEQFFLFTSLAAWLIRTNGKHLEPPQVGSDDAVF